MTVTLAQPLPQDAVFQVTAIGTPPRGLKDTQGRFLDGNGDGRPGGNFTAQFGREPARANRGGAVARLSSAAVDTLLATGILEGRTRAAAVGREPR